MKLPIKASLKTKMGFHKSIDIPELREYIEIAEFQDSPFSMASPAIDSEPLESTIRKLTFKLIRYKEVEQNKGLKHIVAVYEEI